MSHRIDFLEKHTATEVDVLAASSLDTMPGPGYLRVYACEIVDTGRIEIAPANHADPTGAAAQHIIERATTPEIRAYDPHWETEVFGGEKVVITLSGTISECLLWVTWIGAG